jgi:membrane associated rhomboid family serine protease
MVPLRDDNPTSITPFVTYGLIGVNIAIFLYELSLTAPQLQQFFDVWAVVPKELSTSLTGHATGQPVPEWATLLSSQFLHGGFLHIAGNMLFLWVFGNNIEDRLGHIKFLMFYLVCGALAALTQWYFSQQSSLPSLGASGAIAGVMGAYILRFPKAWILTLIPLGIFITAFRIPAVFFLGFWFVEQAISGIASLGASTSANSSGVAYWAHAGGFIFGAILGPLLGLFAPTSAGRHR